ncbi:putative het domain protein [Rosellinia necatrix]|uniref:Putative het domain protein n=1 Tax=Rosellinia necatrix TaxID=77044 RepID=A0A1S8A550_ROSNE|nr:putative het domain protein [Rosellinia necatrix]
MPTYHYSSLPEGYVRLLRLMPDQDEHAPIQCQLFDYFLMDSRKGSHLYEALSYVWGSSEKPQSVSIDKNYLHVTTNLFIALKRLRDRSLDRIIWVDAICINQDDTEERNHQVQFIAKIYAKASRVIVWLEEEMDASSQVHGEQIADISRALEEVRIAADDQYTKSSVRKTNQQAILMLLQRSWFRRIWVLQEVAAARQVLIMCHSTEIDGYTFCLGLDVLKLASKNLDTQSLIDSAAYLIRGAIFRPKCMADRSDWFSLNIRPLVELIEIYHNREATDRRDKVYALLGMSSDDYIPAGLSPDYKILWKDLFCQLVQSIIGKHASVQTWGEEEIALIQSKGCVLGVVSSVRSDGAWDGLQHLDINSKNTFRYLGQEMEWGGRWTLQTSAKSIRHGDIVCLLQGASKPTIIRIYKDYCAVIAIAVTPTESKLTRQGDIDWPDFLRSMTTFPRDFLLIWDWEEPWEKAEDGHGYDCFINSRVPKHAKTELEDHSGKATRLRDAGLILQDSEKYAVAEQNLRKAMKGHERAPGKELSHTLAAMDSLAFVHKEAKHFRKAEELFLHVLQTRKRVLGVGHPDTLQNMASLALTYRSQGKGEKAEGQEVMMSLLQRSGDYAQIAEEDITHIAGSFDQEIMKLLLDRRGDEVQITGAVVAAAVGNYWNGIEVTTVLLDQGGYEAQITEAVVAAAAGNWNSGKEAITLLLDRRDVKVRITEGAIIQTARLFNQEIVGLLLDRGGDGIQINEAVVVAAARNHWNGTEVMALLLDRRGDEVQITEAVVAAAAGNMGCGIGVMALLFDRRGDEVQITERAITRIARLFDHDMIEILLDRAGNDIKIAKDVVMAAAGNPHSKKEVMRFLLNRKEKAWITEEAIVQITRLFDEEAVRLLPDRRGHRAEITTAVTVIEAPTSNGKHRELLKRLKHGRGIGNK